MATTRLIRFVGTRWASRRLKVSITTLEQVRRLVAAHGRLAIPINELDDRDNLFAFGLRSFAAVQLVLAIEDTFEVKIEDFAGFDTIRSISERISKLVVAA